MTGKDHIIKEAQQIIDRYEKRYESEFGLYDRTKIKRKNKTKLAFKKGVFIAVISCLVIIVVMKFIFLN